MTIARDTYMDTSGAADFHAIDDDNPPNTNAPPLRWNEPAMLLSNTSNTRSSTHQRKRKASNASTGTADAASKRTRQNSPSPGLTADMTSEPPKPRAHSRSKSPAPPSFSAALSPHLSCLEVPDPNAVEKPHTPTEPEDISPLPFPMLSTPSLPISITESPNSTPSTSNRPACSRITSSTATDLWWFFVGVTYNERPSTLPFVDIPGVKSVRPDPNHFPYLRCALW
jgi:hypothetical protein